MTVRSASQRAWTRLGELLAERREELDARYYSRAVFAEERGINLKLAQDIETSARRNFTPPTLQDVIARAYGVTYASIRAVLDEHPGSDLEAAPRTPLRRGAPARPAAAPPAPPLAEEDLPAAMAILQEIHATLGRLRDEGVFRPAGEQVFGEGSPDAYPWDWLLAKGFDVPEVAGAVAVIKASARAGEANHAAGLAAAGRRTGGPPPRRLPSGNDRRRGGRCRKKHVISACSQGPGGVPGAQVSTWYEGLEKRSPAVPGEGTI